MNELHTGATALHGRCRVEVLICGRRWECLYQGSQVDCETYRETYGNPERTYRVVSELEIQVERARLIYGAMG